MSRSCPAGAQTQSFSQPEVQADPFSLVHHLLSLEQPITHDPTGGFYIASRWNDVAHIYAHPEIFSSRMEFIFYRPDSPLWPEMERRYRERGFLPMLTLVTDDPPQHTRHRALVDRVFSVPTVAALVPRINEIVDSLIDRFIARGRADLMPELAVLTPLSVISEQMGVPESERQQLKRYGDAVMERLDPLIPPERELEIVDEIIDFQNFIYNKARHYEREPADVLLSKLVHVDIDGQRLDPRALVNIMFQILVAGHETTTSAIGSAILTLLRNPDVRDKLVAEPDLIPNFVEEALRQHPPVLSGFRKVLSDTEVNGVALPQGAFVLTSHICANYDPAQWQCPEAIDLQRKKLRQHMTFGRGIHYCIGNVLARHEIRIVLERVLARLPNLRLDPDLPPPSWAKTFHSHRLEQLNVVF